MSDSPPADSKPKKPFFRRKWVRVILFVFIALIGVGVLVNGPVARMVVKDQLTKVLAAEGLQGSLEVEGHIHHGFTLRKMKFTGDGRISKLGAKEITLRYSLLDVINKELELIKSDGLVVEMNLDAPTKEKVKKESKPLWETLEGIRPFLIPPKIEMVDTRFLMKRGGTVTSVSLAELAHVSGAEDFEFLGWKSSLPGDLVEEDPKSVLTWGTEKMTLDQLKAVSGLEIENFQINENSRMEGELGFAGGKVDFFAELPEEAGLELKSGTVDLSKVMAIAAPDVKLEGFVQTLDAGFKIEEGELPTVDLELEAGALSFNNTPLPNFQAEVDYVKGIPVATLRILPGKEEMTLKLTTSSEVTVENWADAVVDFSLEAPFGRHPLIPVPYGLEGKLTASGKVELAKDPAEITAVADLRVEATQMLDGAETVLDPLTGTVKYAGQKVDASLATLSERFSVDAVYEVPTKYVDAKVTADFENAAILQPYMDIFVNRPAVAAAEKAAANDDPADDKDPMRIELTGPLDLTVDYAGVPAPFSGKGSLNLESATVVASSVPLDFGLTDDPEDAPKKRAVILSAKASMDWPGEVLVESLVAKSDDQVLELAGGWADNRATVETLSLKASGEELLTAHGSFPLPFGPAKKVVDVAPDGVAVELATAEVKDDFLTGPIDFELSSKALTLATLRNLFPLPESLKTMDATVEADLKVGGTLAEPSVDGEISVLQLRDSRHEGMAPADFRLAMENREGRLFLNGTLVEKEGPLLKLDASIPFEPAKWLENDAELRIPAVYEIDVAFGKSPLIPAPNDLVGKLTAQGDAKLAKDPAAITADATYRVEAAQKLADKTTELPPLEGTVKYEDQKVTATARTLGGKVALDVAFEPGTGKLDTSLKADLAEAKDLQPYLDVFVNGPKPDGDPENPAADAVEKVSNLALKGPVNLEAKFEGTTSPFEGTGTLDLEPLTVIPGGGKPETTVSAKASWDWPNEALIDVLKIEAGGNTLEFSGNWSENVATVDKLTLEAGNERLLTGEGTFPLPLTGAKNGAEAAPLDFKVTSQPIELDTLRTLLPLPDSLKTVKGTLNANFDLAGTLEKPMVDGNISLRKVRDTSRPEIPPADLNLDIENREGRLFVDGKLTEPGGELLSIDGSIPFLPGDWMKNGAPPDLPITLDVKSPKLQLDRFRPFIPEKVEAFSGTAAVDLKIRGTMKEPTYNGGMNLKVDRARIADIPFSDLRDSDLNISFEGRKMTLEPSTLTSAGGKINLSGSADLSGDEPVLDVRITGDNALLARNDLFSLRADAELRLTGPYSQATLSGTVGIVESLVYKDLDILPLKMSKSATPKPDLPTFGEATGESVGRVPEPFASWPLDLRVFTKDPILVRGNLAEGAITGEAKLGGTIGNYRPSGTIQIDKLTASLPFSDLTISGGTVTLRPDQPLNPGLAIRGTSDINSYDVQVYVGGDVKDPQISYFSSPPLPESEILTLLATGATSEALEDQKVASQKALQYLIEGLRRRFADGGDGPVQQLLKNADQVELALGEDNPLNGRRFTSASVDFSDNWSVTAAIDDQGQSRGLLTYSLKFK